MVSPATCSRSTARTGTACKLPVLRKLQTRIACCAFQLASYDCKSWRPVPDAQQQACASHPVWRNRQAELWQLARARMRIISPDMYAAARYRYLRHDPSLARSICLHIDRVPAAAAVRARARSDHSAAVQMVSPALIRTYRTRIDASAARTGGSTGPGPEAASCTCSAPSWVSSSLES